MHATLGFGFLESAYGDALEIEFKKSGVSYVREDPVRIYYDGQPLAHDVIKPAAEPQTEDRNEITTRGWESRSEGAAVAEPPLSTVGV